VRYRPSLPAAGFTNSGSRSGDKLSTLVQIALFAAQHGMHWVNLDLPPANCSTTGSEGDLNRLGFWLGAAAQSNVDQGPEVAPPEADLATARHLRRRVSAVTQQFVRGRSPTVRGEYAHQPSLSVAGGVELRFSLRRVRSLGTLGADAAPVKRE
jgi:hypothetical protein